MDVQNKGKTTTIESKKFREMIILELVGETRNTGNSKRGRPGSADHEQRLNWTAPHFINQTNGKCKKCKVCSNRKPGKRKETRFFCETCQRTRTSPW